MRRVAICLAAAFAALSALVGAGVLTRIDQHATSHWMAGLEPSSVGKPTIMDALVPHVAGGSAASIATDVWLYPASAPFSALVVGLCGWLLWRRGRQREAALWCAAWIAGDAVELLVKSVLLRPALYAADGGVVYHIVAFDDSLPSGHTLRSVLAAAAVGAVAPRVGRAVALWAASVAPLLVVEGWHTPSDVLGGLLLAGFAIALVRLYAPRTRPTSDAKASTSSAVVSHDVIQRTTPSRSSQT